MSEYEAALHTMFDKAKKYDQLIQLNQGRRIHCSFCGKDQEYVEKLVAGNNVYICNECISLCVEILDESTNENITKSPENEITPS